MAERHVMRGIAISQRIRKRVEEIFGWMKTTGGFRRTRYLGLDKTHMAGYLVASAYNLVRMVRLVAAAVPAARPADPRRIASRGTATPLLHPLTHQSDLIRLPFFDRTACASASSAAC